MTEQVESTDIRTDSINLSGEAAAKVKALLEQEGRTDLQLRIAVQPGQHRHPPDCFGSPSAGG